MYSNPRTVLLLRLLLLSLSLGISLLAFKWISERFFFDKLYYQKSVKFGYWVPGKKLSLEDFGKRSQDVIQLTKGRNQRTRKDNILKLAVIGDSFVWGQGIQNSERFPEVLEKMLSKIRPARVYSLALCGDNLLDNFVKLKISSRLDPDISLFIFGIVENDLLLNPDLRYDAPMEKKLLDACPGRYIYQPFYNPRLPQEKEYQKSLSESIDDRNANVCLLHNIVQLLPKTHALYLNFGIQHSQALNHLIQVLRENGLTVVSPWDYSDIYSSYRRLPRFSLVVSKKESFHPSALANKMYAEMLFEEIVHPRYRHASAPLPHQ